MAEPVAKAANDDKRPTLGRRGARAGVAVWDFALHAVMFSAVLAGAVVAAVGVAIGVAGAALLGGRGKRRRAGWTPVVVAS